MGFNPATDNVGGTVDESPVVISRFPKGPPDNLLDVAAGTAVGGREGLGYCPEALKHLPVRLRRVILRILGALGDPLPQCFRPDSLPVDQEFVPAPPLDPAST